MNHRKMGRLATTEICRCNVEPLEILEDFFLFFSKSWRECSLLTSPVQTRWSPSKFINFWLVFGVPKAWHAAACCASRPLWAETLRSMMHCEPPEWRVRRSWNSTAASSVPASFQRGRLGSLWARPFLQMEWGPLSSGRLLVSMVRQPWQSSKHWSCGMNSHYDQVALLLLNEWTISNQK